MNKFTSLVVAALFLVITPVAMANITLSGAYFVADAQAESYILGPVSDHDEGFNPVTAAVDLGDQQSHVASAAISTWFNLNAASGVIIGPGDVGGAVSSAGSLLLELTSDTSWILDIGTVSSFDSSPYGLAEVAATIAVSDLDSTLIYNYDVTVDGVADSVVIGPGSYNLLFGIMSAAAVPELSDVVEYAYSSVDLSANISPVPVPSAALLSSIGVGMVGCWFRKRKIKHS
jgi:hypothetical protein